MQNASMEFDVDKLCPTYKLYIGIPGKSNAFEISRRLGLDDAIIEQAKQYLKHEDVAFEDVLSGAEEQRRLAEQQANELTEELRLAKAEREALETERKKIKEDRAQIREKAREEARAVVQQTKHEMDELIRNLRNVKNIDTKALERAIQSSRDALRESTNKLLDQPETPETAGEIPASVVRGQAVRVVSLNSNATVLKPQDQKGMVQVQAGLIKVFVPLSDLRTVDSKKVENRVVTKPREIMQDIKTVKYELDLRGFLVDDAILEIDAFIDDCIRTGRSEFNIIHGKGTGALRAGVQNYLKTHPRVKSFRIGAYGEGDAGVTVVTLKD